MQATSSSQDSVLHPVSWKAAGLAGVCALFFLGFSVEPSVFWGDSASFASHLDTDPKPFARSYWLYKGLGKILVWIGFTPAAAAGYASAVFAAASIGLLHAFSQRVSGSLTAGTIAAGSLCVAHTFWLHGTVAEVYSLLVLLEIGLLFLALGAPSRREEAFGLGALAGLALNHHRLLLFALPVIALYLWLSTSAGQRRSCLRSVGLGLALGALPWLFLCLTYPPSSLLSVPENEQLSVWVQKLLVGGRWSGSQIGAAEGESVLFSVIYLCKLLPLNFPSPAGILALLGLHTLRTFNAARQVLFVGLLIVFVLAGSLFSWTGDQYAFFTPLLPLVSLLAGIGLSHNLLARWSLLAPLAISLSIAAPPALYAVLAFGPSSSSLSPADRLERQEFLWPAKAGYDFPEEWVRDRLTELPPGARLVSQWAEGTVVEYLQERGLRPDIRLELHRSGPLDNTRLDGPVFVSWKPTRKGPPEALLSQGIQLRVIEPGMSQVVVPTSGSAGGGLDDKEATTDTPPVAGGKADSTAQPESNLAPPITPADP